jgi:CTP:molybdopterin cytidylyltransferase MocA
MGRPKGLCVLPDDPRCFLARIAALYRRHRIPVSVVTTVAAGAAYRAALDGGRDLHWLERPGGAGTAASVTAALAAHGGEATHLWLHPVDLPRVAAGTLDRLRDLSRRQPGAVLVPQHDGRPGHPVVLPVAPFRELAGETRDGAMRAWLLELTAPGPDRLAPLIPLAVGDPGCVEDYDDPADLGRDPAAGGEEARQ